MLLDKYDTDELDIRTPEGVSVWRSDYLNYNCIGRYNILTKVITLNTRYSEADQFLTYIHEIGHAICQTDNCQCFNDNSFDNLVLSEIHTNLFVIKHLDKYPELVGRFIEVVELQENAGSKVYHASAIRLKKTKEYKRLEHEHCGANNHGY